MVIKRYLSESNVTRMEEDFKFFVGHDSRISWRDGFGTEG